MPTYWEGLNARNTEEPTLEHRVSSQETCVQCYGNLTSVNPIHMSFKIACVTGWTKADYFYSLITVIVSV